MSSDEKPMCKYGATCYRKNADHQKAYRHPKRKPEEKDSTDTKPAKVAKKESPTTTRTIETFFKKNEDKGTETKKEESHTVVPDVSKADEEVSEDEAIASDESCPESDVDYPDSPENIRENVEQKYKMEMPDDLYDFWEFSQSLNSSKPLEALKDLLGFVLVGPFDILAGRYKKGVNNRHGKKPNFMLHWRYYYDPPEFTTILKGDDEKQFHLGYFRDDPQELPVFVAENCAKDSCKIIPKGDNLFAAVRFYVNEKLKCKDTSSERKKRLEDLSDKLKNAATDKKYSLDLKTSAMKERGKKVNCDTFHGAGMVVPFDEETEVGYRPVPETPGDLKKMLKKIANSTTEKERNENFDPLQEIITLIQFANDECDYGEGLELGLDIFSFGGKVFNSTVLNLMPLAYQLLNRLLFKDIIERHIKCRKHTADLSEID